MGDLDHCQNLLTKLTKCPGLHAQLLTVLVRDAINNGTVELAHAMVTRLFELTHALKAGETPQVPISEMSVSSGDLLRTSLQLLALPRAEGTSAQQQLDCYIGQPCDWSHITQDEGFGGLENAGLDLLYPQVYKIQTHIVLHHGTSLGFHWFRASSYSNTIAFMKGYTVQWRLYIVL
jgi:hypothetical protein